MRAAKPVPMTTTVMRAVTYCRFSSDMQKDSSIEDQQRNCARRAEREEGWSVVRQFVDRAISGADDKRPAYVAMQEAAARHEFDVLIVDDLSRLARDSLEQERVIRRLEHRGILLVSASDGYDGRSESRAMLRQVKGSMNEEFRRQLARHIKRGQEGQAEKGYWLGAKPYGYALRNDRDRRQLDSKGEPMRLGTLLVPDPKQSKVVRQIFERFAAGESALTIARDLNSRAVPHPGATRKRKSGRASSGWITSTIRSILRNPVYRGSQRWGTSTFVKDPDTGVKVRRMRTGGVQKQREDIRLVSDALFAGAQRRMQSMTTPNATNPAGGKAKHLLAGLLHCAVCGCAFVISGKDDHASYGCGQRTKGPKCTNRARCKRLDLERALIGPILEELRDPARVAKMAREMQAEFARRMQEQQARAAGVPREVQELDARITKYRGMADLDADDREALIAKAQAKRAELMSLQPAQRAQAKVLTMLPRTASAYLKTLDDGLQGAPRAAAHARAILRQILGDVKLYAGDRGSVYAAHFRDLWCLVRGPGTGGNPLAIRIKSREKSLVAESSSVLHSWCVQADWNAPTVVGGKGATFWDDAGHSYLDMSSLAECMNLGHQHPRLIRAIQDQAAMLCFVNSSWGAASRAALADRLLEISGFEGGRVFFTLGGADANEHAVKFARQASGRPQGKIIARDRSYHGASYATMAWSGDSRTRSGDEAAYGVLRVPAPYAYRCPFGSTSAAECANRNVAQIGAVIAEAGADNVAAVLMEPNAGTNGIVAPANFWPGLREETRRHGVYLIADEVMSGFGRCGEWFAWAAHGDAGKPDLMTLAKGLTGAHIPLGAVVLAPHVAARLENSMLNTGLTYCGHPLACAAGVAAIAAYQEENLIARSRTLGRRMLQRLHAMQDLHAVIGDVRGADGLFAIVELVKDRRSREPLAAWPGVHPSMSRFVALGRERGISFAVRGNLIILAPPLVIGENELERALDTMNALLGELNWS